MGKNKNILKETGREREDTLISFSKNNSRYLTLMKGGIQKN